MRNKTVLAGSCLGLILLVAPLPAAPPKIITLPEGTPLQVQADSKVASDSVKTGDGIVLRCTAPVTVGGYTVIAQDAAAQASVMYAQGAGVGHGGQLFLSIDSVQAVDGSWLPLTVNAKAQEGDHATLPERLTPLGGGGFPKGRERILQSTPFEIYVAEETRFAVRSTRVVAEPLPKTRRQSVLLPRQTPVLAKLDHDIKTGDVRTGQAIEFRVASPVTVAGKTLINQGSRANGHAVLANPSGPGGRGGQLVLSIDTVQAVDGSWIPVQAATSNNGGKNRALRAGLRFVSPVAAIIPGRQGVVSASQSFEVMTHRNAYVKP